MTGEPTLFKLRARVGDADTPRLDVSLSVDSPGVIGVIGPNGAGKTTLLRAIAGLEDLGGAATVQVRDRNVTDESPSRRRVAYVPQSGALFPHLSVLDNVAYGLRATGVRRSAARERAQTYLRTLQIDDLADRSPQRLSGGQRQRVAIARALAVNPDVILLDEPTASLDAAGRVDVRAVLHRHLVNFPGVAILVTHDASEVLTLARRVLVLERGVVTQDASSAELIQRPGSRWLAQMLNLNAWSGVVTSRDAVGLDAGGVLHAVELPSTGTHVLATASPTSITLFPEPPTGSARNVWAATVQEVSVLGDRVRVTFVATNPNAGPHETVAEVTRDAADELAISQGTRVFAAIKATDLSVSAY